MRFLTSASVLIALSLLPSAAVAAERVQDGGFDAATCTPSDCTSPVWSETASTGLVGPICTAGTGNCGYFQGANQVGYNSVPNWVQMGGPDAASSSLSWSVEQVVDIPAAPATLRFVLLIKNSSISTGSFAAKIDGATVFSAAGTTPGFAAYAPVNVDVSGFAGASRMLRFEATDVCNGCIGSTDSFNVDDVSLDAPNASPTAPAPTGLTGRCTGKSATVVGTASSELVQGTPGSDVIAALGGDDIIKSGKGNDIVCGGPGNDELRGQKGNDKLFGDNGKDKLAGGKGKHDLCNGGAGKDTAVSSCEKTRDLVRISRRSPIAR